MTYRVMAKRKYGKNFQCYRTHEEAKYADNTAKSLTDASWTIAVKIICIDDNGIRNELIYK